MLKEMFLSSIIGITLGQSNPSQAGFKPKLLQIELEGRVVNVKNYPAKVGDFEKKKFVFPDKRLAINKGDFVFSSYFYNQCQKYGSKHNYKISNVDSYSKYTNQTNNHSIVAYSTIELTNLNNQKLGCTISIASTLNTDNNTHNVFGRNFGYYSFVISKLESKEATVQNIEPIVNLEVEATKFRIQ
jgi:hypothetical protein